ISAMLRLPHVVKRDRETRQECEKYLDQIGLIAYKDVQAGSLPYGIQRKLEIARALATKPKLLFLDEPAAGMNTAESAELVGFLKQIHDEHHLDVVMNVCSRINVLNLGELLFTGSPQEVQTNPEVIRAYIGERRKSHA
ncbi:MAG: ATP-binding cassette domain-containing protein, partial [Candidatus Aphodomorpha sp.]